MCIRDRRYQATHDALTGVNNRGRITEVLQEHVAGPGPLGVIMLDLDKFKGVNDTFGPVSYTHLTLPTSDLV